MRVGVFDPAHRDPRRSDAIETMASLHLDARGTVMDCSRGAEVLLQRPRVELLGRHVGELIPALAGKRFMEAALMNPELAFRCRCGFPFFALLPEGDELRVDLSMTAIGAGAPGPVLLVVRPHAAADAEPA